MKIELDVNAAQLELIKRIMRCPDPIAMKLWGEEDAINAFECTNGRKPTSTELANMLQMMDLGILEDCTDSEWDMIYDAAYHAFVE